MPLGSETAALLSHAINALNHQMSPAQHALLSADERKAALLHFAATVDVAAKLAEGALVDSLAARVASCTETERIWAETERLRAEAERLKAERIWAETERLKAETERQKAETETIGRRVEWSEVEKERRKAEAEEAVVEKERMKAEAEKAVVEEERLKTKAKWEKFLAA